MILQALIPGRIGHSRGDEARAAQPAGIAPSAGSTSRIRLITGHCLAVIDLQSRTLTDDLGLGPANERCVDATRLTFDACPGRERRNSGEGRDELRTAVRITARVENVD